MLLWVTLIVQTVWINFQPPSEDIQNHIFEIFISNSFMQYVTDPMYINNIFDIVLSSDHTLLDNINVVLSSDQPYWIISTECNHLLPAIVAPSDLA